jgi:signal transduction histidine kinase
LSAVFLRPIDAMITTAREIEGGDLGRRIPLAKGGADLQRLADAFNRMLDRIAALVDANKQVSSAIAHDLRKPLARVLRGLKQARTGPADVAEYEKAVDAASTDVHGVLETFNALLRIAQIESGTRRANFRDVDLAAIALEVAEAFKPAATDEGKTLSLDLDTRLPTFGDRELLTQLAANLIDNAIRHTPQGTRILVKAVKDAAGARLIVADDGPGVPAAEHDRIFERFYRLDVARTTPGDGLGLSLGGGDRRIAWCESVGARQ